MIPSLSQIIQGDICSFILTYHAERQPGSSVVIVKVYRPLATSGVQDVE